MARVKNNPNRGLNKEQKLARVHQLALLGYSREETCRLLLLNTLYDLDPKMGDEELVLAYNKGLIDRKQIEQAGAMSYLKYLAQKPPEEIEPGEAKLLIQSKISSDSADARRQEISISQAYRREKSEREKKYLDVRVREMELATQKLDSEYVVISEEGDDAWLEAYKYEPQDRIDVPVNVPAQYLPPAPVEKKEEVNIEESSSEQTPSGAS